MRSQNRVTIFNMLSTVLLYGISVFTAPLFSRMLGTSGYGIFSVYSTWVFVAAIVFTLQTQSTLANALVEFPEEEQPRYQSSVLSLTCLVFLLFSGVVLIFLEPISQFLQLHKIIIGLILFHAFGTYCINFLTAKFTYEFKAGKNFALSIGITLVTMVLSIVLIQLLPENINYYGRILAVALPYGILGIAIAAYILFHGKTFYHKKYWQFCVPLALPLVFHSLSDLLLGQSDRVMLQQLTTDAMVGKYSLAANFANILYTILTTLNNSWCPFFYDNMKQGKLDAVDRQSRNLMELFTILAMGFVLLSTEVFHIFAGQDFWDGTNLIPIFVVSYYMVFLCNFPVNYEVYQKKTRAVAAATITASVCNLVLNFFMIRHWGIWGAAAATAISHGLQFLLHYIYARYHLGKDAYPFRVGMWLPYLGAFALVVIFSTLTQGQWLLRWGLGALLGIWEVYRLYKRKTIF